MRFAGNGFAPELYTVLVDVDRGAIYDDEA